MSVNDKTNCPHISKNNLLDIERFKAISFEKIKCQKCNETKELKICLICGELFCCNNNNHFIEHNKENKGHCLGISTVDSNISCYECKSDDNKGCVIESDITKKYREIIEEFNKNNGENNENDLKNKLIFNDKKEICLHIKDEDIINDFKDYLNTFFKVGLPMMMNHKDKNIFGGFCLVCGDRLDNLESLDEHYNEQKHKLFINLLDFTVICMECKSKYDFVLMNDLKKYRIIFQRLTEKELKLPKEVKLLTKEEIFKIKYEKFINDFKNNKFKSILFMVGAGISTSAGIPDFRSNTGLFKQLQDKYKLSSPEEFFLKSTFLSNPMYFYEFTKLFDLSKVKATISHKFMSFLVHKKMVKYIFTQNIDGLEKKAKIPDEKLVFAHGNFYTGHCAQCNIPIDIKKINEGVKKGKVYYCPKCKGPCKPNVVFYGEGLPTRFFEKIEDSKNVDLIIIMGTSLKVNPFASLPYFTNPDAYKLVFNMEEVGNFGYDYLECDDLFIEGKTDKNIIQFLKDTNLFEEFSKFIKDEYNEDINNIIDKEVELMKVSDNKDNNNNIEKITDDLGKINLNEKK